MEFNYLQFKNLGGADIQDTSQIRHQCMIILQHHQQVCNLPHNEAKGPG